MKQVADALGQPLLRTTALALVHFLWQGALVALLLGAANAALGHRSARARYLAACSALAVMLALPLVTAWRLGPISAAPSAASAEVPASAAAPERAGADPASAPARLLSAGSLAPGIVLAWLAGVSFLSVRFLGGCLAARRLRIRLTRRPEERFEQRLSALASRLRVRRPVRLLESALVSVPTAMGILRPLILLPLGTLTGIASDQLDALLAHELAHIRRGDCLVTLFQALAETVLFYHPAVWWVSSRVRIERENVCDDLAVAATGDPEAYARALVDLAERRSLAPRLAVAADGGFLWRRITRLGPDGTSGGNPSPRWLGAAIALGGLLVLGVAARVPAPARPTPPLRNATETPRPAARAEESDSTHGDPPVAPANRTGRRGPAEGSPSSPRPLLSPDQLIAFRIHGVTPEFIEGIVALGYDAASPDELVAMRVHGVSPDFIAQMAVVFGKLPLEKYTELRIHGVDAAYVRAFRDAGFASISADEAVSLRIHGVDAADAAAWKRLGFEARSIDALVSLRIHGATPEFGQAMRDLGVRDLSIDGLVGLRIHGATPEYVREIQSLGYPSLSVDDVTAFRIHGVTAEWIRAANHGAGGKLTKDELIDWRIHERRTDRTVEE